MKKEKEMDIQPEQKKDTSADQVSAQEETDKQEESPQGSKKEKMVKIKESEYKRLQEELDQYKDKYVRLYAEFDNARKRMEREKMEFVKFANEGVLADFLDVIDNLERSINVAKSKHEDYDAFLKGIDMIWKQVEEFLKKNNVEPIEAKGKKFDHNYHEVLMQEETDDVEEDTVLEEYQKGYTLNQKVLRTAKVKLSKKPAQEAADESLGSTEETDRTKEPQKNVENNENQKE
jgi:molecular chaperone GrpE